VVTTGYTDTFNRTVANGLGVATSGQTYSLSGTSTQFNVTPSTATIFIASTGIRLGYVDLQSQNVDITGQVALNAIPATNLATAGFVAKMSSTSNHFSGVMMVATGGAISLRFSKVVSGGLVTIATVATGLTYVANTFYNLRYSIFWSRPLQTNVMSLKLWAVGAPEPGGWMATATDASFTDYTAGTNVGLFARDESSVVGTITASYRSVSALSYHLPVPATADPMCYDPAVAYPRQEALESLADAADAAMAAIDPLVSLVAAFPRVRISNSNVAIDTSTFTGTLVFNATEFNVGTDTNLGYDNTSLYLPVGYWLVTFEIKLVEAASNFLLLLPFGGGPTSGEPIIDFRSNASQSNDQGVGGTGHFSALTLSTDPTTPIRYAITLSANNPATTYTIQYMALSAVKISDYFA
jgi:hypothetical protein